MFNIAISKLKYRWDNYYKILQKEVVIETGIEKKTFNFNCVLHTFHLKLSSLIILGLISIYYKSLSKKVSY